MRREAASGKERGDNGTRGRNPEKNAECTNHPLAVTADPALADIPKSEAKKEKEQQGEKRSGGSFVRAADRHRLAHH